MTDTPENAEDGLVRKLKWRTPTLTEDLIADSTRNRFGAGIDNYELANPVGYGS